MLAQQIKMNSSHDAQTKFCLFVKRLESISEQLTLIVTTTACALSLHTHDYI